MKADPFVKKLLIVAGLLVIGAAGTLFLARAEWLEQGRLQAFFSSVPLGLSAALFVVCYVLSSFVVVDLKDIFKIVAALIFGAWWSALFIWIAEMINNVILFHLARRLGREWLERRFRLDGKDVGFVRTMCGLPQIFILRAVPLLPYRILDIAYGLTAVAFLRYFTVSAVASPVRILWLQFVLAGVGAAVMDPQKLSAFLMEHPLFVRLSFAYLVIGIVTAIVLNRRRT